MHCPKCDTTDTKVADSRIADDGSKVKRRRNCLACDYKFTTFESIDLTLPRIIKLDGTRQNYDQDKIRNGILRSIEKRPVTTEEVDKLLINTKQRLISLSEKEVSTHQIGEWVLQELKLLDEVAYVRFASVYRSFQNISDFVEMIEGLSLDAEQ